MKWQKGTYSPDDVASMQKDAMARVREMQRKADENLRRSNAAIPTPPKAEAPPLPPPPPMEKPASPPSPPPEHGKLMQILSAAGIDNDRLIILGLLLLLYNDGADHLLLLALLYLFL